MTTSESAVQAGGVAGPVPRAPPPHLTAAAPHLRPLLPPRPGAHSRAGRGGRRRGLILPPGVVLCGNKFALRDEFVPKRRLRANGNERYYLIHDGSGAAVVGGGPVWVSRVRRGAAGVADVR